MFVGLTADSDFALQEIIRTFLRHELKINDPLDEILGAEIATVPVGEKAEIFGVAVKRK